jgi:predicted membrane-bound spermidine synthase
MPRIWRAMNRVAGFDDACESTLHSTTAAVEREVAGPRLYLAGMVALLLIVETLSAVTGIVRPAHATFLAFLQAPLSFPFLAFSLLASSVVVLGERNHSDRLRTLIGGGVLAALWLVWPRAASASAVEACAIVMASLGGAALLALGWRAARASSSGIGDGSAERTLIVAASFPLFVLVSNFFLHLTAALLPRTYDAPLFHFDESLGWNAAFALGQLLDRVPVVKALVRLNYLLLPVAAAALFVASAGKREASVLARVLLLAPAAAYLCYFLYPAAGPRYLFGPAYPDGTVLPDRVPLSLLVVVPYPRNCMPSLHTAWALLLVLNARAAGRWLRIALVGALGLTVLGTLGLGEHYLVDLVVAVPFAVAVQAAGTMGDRRSRYRISAAAGVLVAAWLAYLIIGSSAFPRLGLLHWVAMLATLAASALLYQRLRAIPEWSAASSIEQPAAVSRTAPMAVIVVVFFISGFAALLYEVVFSKALALTFGSMAIATNTVLATYMGGIAIGSWLGGHLAYRGRDPLRLYAACEAGIAVACVVLPLGFPILRDVYASAAAGTTSDAGLLTTYRVLLGAAVLSPPTILMGMTLPAMAAHVARQETLGRSVAMLYAANTVGASLGALLTGYFVLPAIGIRGATWTAVVLNLLAALLALRLRGRPAAPGANQPLTTAVVERAVFTDSLPPGRRRVVTALVILGIGGFVTLALEVNLIHLLAVVAGNSAYAFSLMLFAFLVGLGGGACTGRWLLRKEWDPLLGVTWSECLLAGSILASSFLWAAIPDYFASFANYPITRTFAAREFVRAAVCMVAMLPSAFFIGIAYPLAIEVIGRALPSRGMVVLGGAAAINTTGNILGALVGGFLLLPVLGAVVANQALSLVCLGLGALGVLGASASRSRRLALASFLPALVLLFFQPGSLDYTRIASGSNVYFSHQEYGQVIDHAESLDGGLTTVAESRDPDGHRVLTLLTNGKFQGDTSQRREMKAQAGFALAPLLHTTKRDRALIIGLGTGVSARVLHDARFTSLDIVELSADVTRIADKHFRDVNGGVTRRPHVTTHVTDGRNFLLTQDKLYDVISMEIASIWFAGSGALYNREFYQLARRRLASEGILQQWVQLHRISWQDIVAILATVRSEFRYVWLYFIGNQGIIVASNHEALPGPETISAIDDAPALVDVRAAFGGSVQSLLGDRLLTPADTNRLLALTQGYDFISDDDNMFLEYSTPQGNVRDYARSLGENLGALKQIGSRDPRAWTRLEAEAPGPAQPSGPWR